MLLLVESAAGYALFKVRDEKKALEKVDLYKDFESVDGAKKIVELSHFQKFKDTTEALAAATAAVEGKITKPLKKCLKKLEVDDIQQKLLVADAKFGNAIKTKFNVDCLSSNAVQELIKCVRSQLEGLVEGLTSQDSTAMSLGLAHSLSRYKLKFTPDKLDIMMVESIGLLDDIDKELNNYVMRCREWYGWHFPELGKIVSDNVAYAKCVQRIGMRETTAEADLSDLLPENLEQQVKAAAETSIGTEISEEDIINLKYLCDQITSLTEYRSELNQYVEARMMALSPNVSTLLDTIVAARLMAQAGSLMELAKLPASTIQILGAEKALFRALKTKKDTPKYGLIYHAPLISQASTHNKGKMARMVANKVACAARYDALGEDIGIELGAEHKAKLEFKIRVLEEGASNWRLSGYPSKSRVKHEQHHTLSEVKYHDGEPAEMVAVSSKKRNRETDEWEPVVKEESMEPQKKKKKMKKSLGEEESSEAGQSTSTAIKEEPQNDNEEEQPKKKKKSKKSLPEEEAVEEQSSEGQKKKKKKGKKSLQGEEGGEATQPLITVIKEEKNDEDGQVKKKKKAKKSMPEEEEKSSENVEKEGHSKKKKLRKSMMPE